MIRSRKFSESGLAGHASLALKWLCMVAYKFVSLRNLFSSSLPWNLFKDKNITLSALYLVEMLMLIQFLCVCTVWMWSVLPNISEVYTASIFRAEACAVGESLVYTGLCFGRTMGRERAGAPCWPIGTEEDGKLKETVLSRAMELSK
jgi:hypothetical protein